ncbi:MAG: reverse transcriptase/maturase family protein [Patescibacteria group bacterium]|jgi:retron-type reverse transcriptase
MKIQFGHSFEEIISLENLLLAWPEFLRGKRDRRDVQEFSARLMNNILALHHDLKNQTYQHGGYEHFKVFDPKPRDIHKASVRDRLLHHAIYRQLYPFFDRTFITNSYSCRLDKGTHKAVSNFRRMANKVSRNNTRGFWVLQGDIRKFFASINHQILLKISSQYIPNADIRWLLDKVIKSFSTAPGKGLPLGNLTSQLFVNIYMNVFDQFIKHQLKIKHYIRYADDFVIIHENSDYLKSVLTKIRQFLQQELLLELHPGKVFIQKFSQGVDFLGYVSLPRYIVLRTKTKKRMLKKIRLKKQMLEQTLITEASFNQSLQSYLGVLKHCRGRKIERKVWKITQGRQNPSESLVDN